MHESNAIKRFQSHRQGAASAVFALVFALLAGTAALGIMASPNAGAGQAEHAGQPVRIGTYDSRAVAVAYVRSDASAATLQELMRERSEAEAKGNTQRVSELNALGESLQIRRHLQGFSNAPVDDILELVKDQLPEVATRHNVAIITSGADYRDEKAVEIVDVTDALVALFDPDARTLQGIKELRQREPEPIEKIAQTPAVK